MRMEDEEQALKRVSFDAGENDALEMINKWGKDGKTDD